MKGYKVLDENMCAIHGDGMTYELKEAVKQNGCAIRYIENPSEEIQLEAVKQDGYAIKYIANPSEAVKKNVEVGENYGQIKRS